MVNFTEIAKARQSCRKYDCARVVEREKLDRILEAARLSPSACNGQPYRVTVLHGALAKSAARATQGMGMNRFASEAPVLLVISEMPYVKTAALGAKLKGNDYRSIDIGILAAYLTAQATSEGLGSCILGWFDEAALRQICGVDGTVRLVITLGYAAPGDPLREKKRKPGCELFSELE